MTEVTIKLLYGKDVATDADVKTNDVPYSLIIESLNVLTKHFAQEMVKDAGHVIDLNDREELEKYLDARIKVDKQKLL